MSLVDDKQKLAKIVSSLGGTQRRSLIEFAEFLLSKTKSDQNSSQNDPAILQKPKEILRPEKETVIGAIKRLSSTYAMLDKAKLLNHTSTLMSEHIMKGRVAADVIDDLEKLFLEYYKTYVEELRV